MTRSRSVAVARTRPVRCDVPAKYAIRCASHRPHRAEPTIRRGQVATEPVIGERTSRTGAATVSAPVFKEKPGLHLLANATRRHRAGPTRRTATTSSPRSRG